MTPYTTSLVPIFATPFAVISLPETADLNPVLASLFRRRTTESDRDPGVPRDPLCFRSREDLLEWQDEPVARLRREILGGLCAAVMEANLYTDSEFDALRIQVRARFILVRPNGSIPAASVPLASWCAVYCVAAPPVAAARADSACLRLYVRQGPMFFDAANWRLRPPFGTGHHLWQPLPGQMAVFPASSLHEVALNRSDADLVLVTARARFAHAGQEEMPPW
jgi:hypothetical protein